MCETLLVLLQIPSVHLLALPNCLSVSVCFASKSLHAKLPLAHWSPLPMWTRVEGGGDFAFYSLLPTGTDSCRNMQVQLPCFKEGQALKCNLCFRTFCIMKHRLCLKYFLHLSSHSLSYFHHILLVSLTSSSLKIRKSHLKQWKKMPRI